MMNLCVNCWRAMVRKVHLNPNQPNWGYWDFWELFRGGKGVQYIDDSLDVHRDRILADHVCNV